MKIIIQYFRNDSDEEPTRTLVADSTTGLERETDRLRGIIKQDKEEDSKVASEAAQEVISRSNLGK